MDEQKGETENMAERLRRLRMAKGWTQDELAARAGFSRQTVQRIENGREKNPQMETKVALAAALGESVLYLTMGYCVLESGQVMPTLDEVLRATSKLRESDIANVQEYIAFLEAKAEQQRRDQEQVG